MMIEKGVKKIEFRMKCEGGSGKCSKDDEERGKCVRS